MKIIIAGLVVFVLAAVSLLPHLFASIDLPESYSSFSAVLIMGLAMFIQIQGIYWLRESFRLKKMLLDKDQLEDELQEARARLHHEKRNITELRAKFVAQERQFRQQQEAYMAQISGLREELESFEPVLANRPESNPLIRVVGGGEALN